jgi:tagatose 1,6-diphosphate aldolase
MRAHTAHQERQPVHKLVADEPARRLQSRSMRYRLGAQRGLAACASATGKFAILALDHRQNLRKELRPDDPDAVTFDEMAELKRAIVRVLSRYATGTLLDPEIGAGQAIASGSLPAASGLIVAVEATGFEGPPGDRRSRILADWSVAKAKRLGASAVKLLVYYQPDAPGASDQERLVASVARECEELDLPLFLEPLSFGLDGRPLQGDDRRRVVVATAQRLTALGCDVLKAEFPYDPSVIDRQRWREACEELDAASQVPWVLLSGGVDDALFESQVESACLAGASGILVGRSVWAGAARLDGEERDDWLATEGVRRLYRLVELVERVARPWRDRWLAARPGEPPTEGWYRRY